ncbi:hypothetical protein K491DRAFT_682507 [Lophiostoma macrostomum CBS 122681]|uniref:Uncharacterized protein n=1 Tax=Lophiostoma macrostomum CBS 122681 TaxID=1314788 RepID=A0A6A6SVD7_9PLEO|nr:hypothetical protein K491DRAFT_682507 [Lophiostoma macrostomum CBS 122681]
MSETGPNSSPDQPTAAQIAGALDLGAAGVEPEDAEQVRLALRTLIKCGTEDETGRQEDELLLPTYSFPCERAEDVTSTQANNDVRIAEEEVYTAEAWKLQDLVLRTEDIRERLSVKRKKRKERLVDEDERAGLRQYARRRVEQYSEVCKNYQDAFVAKLEAAGYSYDPAEDSEKNGEDEQIMKGSDDSAMLALKSEPHRDYTTSEMAKTRQTKEDEQEERERHDSVMQAFGGSNTSDTSEGSDTVTIKRRLRITDLLN